MSIRTHPERALIARQLIRFLLVGGASYVLNTGTYSLFVLAGLHYLLAAPISYALGFFFNFYASRHWTFQASTESATRQLARFAIAAVLVLVADLALLWVAVEGAGIPPIPAQAVAILLLAPGSFVLNRVWSFRVAAA